MLDQYLTDTRNLLQNPSAPTSLYAEASLTRWINIARGQLCGEAECIRYRATIDTVVDQREYAFSALDTGDVAMNGISGVINIRDILYAVGSGQKKITPRPWEWFQQFSLNTPVPVSSVPASWAQYGQGAAPGDTGTAGAGSFFIDPPPDQVYTLTCDCVCYPAALAANDEPEAIPYLWTDAVPFFAAYYAYMSSQTSARQADAERMYGQYQAFVERARKASNPSVLRWQYPQATDPTQLNKIGVAKQAGQGG